MTAFIADIDTFFFSLVDALRTPSLDTVMEYITRAGDKGAIWILLSVALCCFQKTRKTGYFILAALVTTYVVSTLGLKNLIARPRPCAADIQNAFFPCPSDYSFPSGHSISSFAATGVLWFRHEKHAIFAVLVAGLIAFSRMYLHVHYVTDVVAGAFLGWMTAYAFSMCAAFKRP